MRDVPCGVSRLTLEIGDVAFLFEDARDGDLHIGGWNDDARVPRRDGVANARQHIRDRISHIHEQALPQAAYQLDLVTPGNSPRKRPLAEADAAQPELAHVAARATAD